MVFIDFCCLLQTLTNASAIITGVIQTLLVRIPWAHTFALAKLDSMDSIDSILFYSKVQQLQQWAFSVFVLTIN